MADLLTYGPLIRALASRDLKARYKQSALGPAWVVFQPLALLAAFTIGFNGVAHVHTDGVPYVLFALAGLAVWTYFQAVTMVATGSIVNNYPLVRWTACPRLALPLATLVSNLPSLVIPGLAAVIVAGAAGYLWVGSLLLPFMCLWLLALVGVTAILLSAITVRARDVLSVVPFMLQVTLFLAPVALPHDLALAGASRADFDQPAHRPARGLALEPPRGAAELDGGSHLVSAHGDRNRLGVETFRPDSRSGWRTKSEP